MFKHQVDVSLFADVAPFDHFTARALRPLVASTDRVRVPAGSVIAHEAQQAREFVVVISGQVEARRAGEPVGSFGPGTQIGGPSLVRGVPHESSVVALTEVELLVVNGPAYRWAARELLIEHA